MPEDELPFERLQKLLMPSDWKPQTKYKGKWDKVCKASY